MKALLVSDIRHRITELDTDIKHEKNGVEKKRLLEEQAALKRTLRMIKQVEVTVKPKVTKKPRPTTKIDNPLGNNEHRCGAY